MNQTIQVVLIVLFGIIVFGGIGTIIHFAMPGYKALEFQKKSNLRNFIESIVDFFKIFSS